MSRLTVVVVKLAICKGLKSIEYAIYAMEPLAISWGPYCFMNITGSISFSEAMGP